MESARSSAMGNAVMMAAWWSVGHLIPMARTGSRPGLARVVEPAPWGVESVWPTRLPTWSRGRRCVYRADSIPPGSIATSRDRAAGLTHLQAVTTHGAEVDDVGCQCERSRTGSLSDHPLVVSDATSMHLAFAGRSPLRVTSQQPHHRGADQHERCTASCSVLRSMQFIPFRTFFQIRPAL